MSSPRSFSKCANPACSYESDVDRQTGHVHSHCCSVCKRWRWSGNAHALSSEDHHRFCKRIRWQACQLVPSDASPARQARSRSPPRRERNAIRNHHHCMVVTLGFHSSEGRALLQANAQLQQYIEDVTELRDHQGGGPPGTDQRTQERVRNTPGFTRLLQRVLGIILTQPLIIIACNHGHHRSVAMAEIAAEWIRDLRSLALTLDVVHVDLNQITPDQKRRLQQWS